jgi:DNA-binding beta-propeller fold protein YncE
MVLVRRGLIVKMAFIFLAFLVFAPVASGGDDSGLATTSERTPSRSPRLKFTLKGFYSDNFRNPMGIFIDKERGEVYVVDNERDEVFIFDLLGTPIFRFGKQQGQRLLSTPIDLVIRGDLIYIAQEGKDFLEVFDQRGNVVKKIVLPGKVFAPGRMDIDGDGNIYVVNKKLSVCYVINAEDEVFLTIGEGLTSLSGVAVGGGKVYLITPFPSRTNVINVYTRSGEFLRSFENIDSRGGTLMLPTAGKVDREENLWLVDSLKSVEIYAPDYKKISSFGRLESAKEMLHHPVDIDFSSSGMIYIVDKDRKSVSVFN